jgi:S1-C subfamily serine protease
VKNGRWRSPKASSNIPGAMRISSLLFGAGAALGLSFACAQAAPPTKSPAPSGSVGGQKTPPALVLPPQTGQPFDDRDLVGYLEQEGRKLLASSLVHRFKIERHLCDVDLTECGQEKLSLARITAKAEAATLILGEFFKDPKSKKVQFATAAGGFLISKTGVVVTCLHVANDKESRGLVAMTRDGQVFPVKEAIAHDPVEDVLVLQLDLPGGTELPALGLAKEPAPVGASVAVMSHPDERFYMLTMGNVARHSIWKEAAGQSHFMAITADFAKGSSGCPVLDEQGSVVGVVNNTESIYYDDDGKKKQLDLQMVVKNVTPSWVVRRLVQSN